MKAADTPLISFTAAFFLIQLQPVLLTLCVQANTFTYTHSVFSITTCRERGREMNWKRKQKQVADVTLVEEQGELLVNLFVLLLLSTWFIIYTHKKTLHSALTSPLWWLTLLIDSTDVHSGINNLPHLLPHSVTDHETLQQPSFARVTLPSSQIAWEFWKDEPSTAAESVVFVSSCCHTGIRQCQNTSSLLSTQIQSVLSWMLTQGTSSRLNRLWVDLCDVLLKKRHRWLSHQHYSHWASAQ